MKSHANLSLCKRKQYVPSALSISNLMLSPIYLHKFELVFSFCNVFIFCMSCKVLSISDFLHFHRSTQCSLKPTCWASQRRSWFLLQWGASSSLWQWSVRQSKLIYSFAYNLRSKNGVQSILQSSHFCMKSPSFNFFLGCTDISWIVYHSFLW